MRVLLALSVSAACLGATLHPNAMPPVPPSSNADRLASEFLASLTPASRKEAHLAFTDEARRSFNFVPMVRKGVPLARLTPEQIASATRLLKSSLSDSGYKTVEQIRVLEDVLFEMENRNPGRDKSMYYFAVFGEPSAAGVWGWRYEGHHVSLNFTYRDGQLVASSPQFLGTNPAEIEQGPFKGKPLGKFEDAGFALLNALDAGQRAKAILRPDAPPDIFTGNQRKAELADRKGLPYAEMDARQKELLSRLIRAHADVLAPEEQKRRMSKVDLSKVVFAWMGASRPRNGTTRQGYYYRVQGDTFLIEVDNTQNQANHVHAVWRDFDGDFGGDALHDHYRTSHSHP